MRMLSQSLIINGKKFDGPELKKLCFDKIALSQRGNWEGVLFAFIAEWLNESPHIVAHTSGTTGAPKEILISKEKMLLSARMTNKFLNLLPGDAALLCLSCEYIAGKMMVARAFAGELNLVPVEPSSSPLKEVNQQIDFAAFIPMQVKEIFKDEESKMRFRRIRKVIIGGAPVSYHLKTLLQEMPNDVYETFGMTETISHIALKNISKGEKYFKALEGVTVHTDVRNCLVIDAKHLSLSLVITNDVVELKDNRSFKWLGRFDNMVNSGGVKLFPEMLEEKMKSLMDADYFLAGMPDAVLGEKLILVIEAPGMNNEEKSLKKKLSLVLGKYEMPKEIFFTQKFQRTAEGKIKRRDTLSKFNRES